MDLIGIILVAFFLGIGLMLGSVMLGARRMFHLGMALSAAALAAVILMLLAGMTKVSG